jgi:RNA polymerase sigma-70 factor, ECF subfamily
VHAKIARMTPDERVRQLIEAGDESTAATEALRALGPEILRYLRSVMKNEDDAGEVFSDFAEKVWKGLQHFRGDSSLRTWGYRIAWNAARDYGDDAHRRRGRRLETSEAHRPGVLLAGDRRHPHRRG